MTTTFQSNGYDYSALSRIIQTTTTTTTTTTPPTDPPSAPPLCDAPPEEPMAAAMNIKPTEAMNWFITRTNPTAARTAAWSTMYGLIAVLTSLIAGVVVVAAAVATARASDGTDNSSPATLSGVGVAAALFGIFSAVLLFITAVAAFFAAYYAKHVSSILYITAAIHAFVCAVTVLTLLLTSLLAFIEANIARDAAVTVQMAVLCTLTSMVAFPFICLILGFISFTMFTTTAKPDND